MKTLRTICSYCSVGCSFDVTLEGGEVKTFLPTKDYPVNLGKSCPKGFHLLKPFASPDRAVRPLLRDDSGKLRPVDWDTALGAFVDAFKGIRERYGEEAAAFISTGQMPMEEMAFLGALFKFGMGFLHADGNTRQCMATAAVAYKQAFGFDAPPYSYKDFELSDLLVFVGANPAIAHPVMWNRVKMNQGNPKIVVIDPRRTKTAEEATLHLAVKPKGDLDLLYAVAHVLTEKGWIDEDFLAASTAGFEEFTAHLGAYAPTAVEEKTGISPAEIEEFARLIHDAGAASFWWTMGVNQSHQGVRTAQAIINLALMTGNIGRPGTGANSITGQANAMGSRLFSNTTSLFSGYDTTNKDDRNTMADLLGIDPSVIPEKNGLPYHKIIEGIDQGRIKGLWVIATNPAHSWIDRNSLYGILEKLDFLVVQDLFTTTETAEMADLVLPAAGSGEKSGILINSERRLGVVEKISDPPGEAKSDFDIFRFIADAWGCRRMFAEWTDPEAVFRILRRTSAGKPCDITGITGYPMIRERGGIQWPYPVEGADDAQERRLFENGRFYTPDGKAKFLFEDPRALPEPVDDEYPVALITGRGTVVQFHTQTRTGKVDMLNRLSPKRCYIEIHPDDAAAWDIIKGDDVEVISRRGKVAAVAEISDTLHRGEIFMPMHYEETNRLTFPAFDPYSAEPAYKHAAVKVRKVSAAEQSSS